MPIFAQDMIIIVDGVPFDPNLHPDEQLPRSVQISLFSWRRALPDDELPGNDKMGWWGDSYASVPNDRIGSRLWLLVRAKLISETILRAREYAVEALQWLIEDGLAVRVDVECERTGIYSMAIICKVYRQDGKFTDLRFPDAWKFIVEAGNKNAI